MSVKEKMTAIADAIRNKTGGTAPLTLDAMAEAIAGIETGGGGGEADYSMEDGLVNGTVIEYRNPRATTIRHHLFFQDGTIQKVTFDSVIVCNNAAFRECSKLTTAIFPSLTKTANDMFYNSKAVVNVSMPNLITMDRYTFQNCTALKFLDFNCLETIMVQALQGSGVETLIIRTNKVCTMQDATKNTQMTVYVPSALIESYKTATNWSTLYAAGTCNFVAIEGSEYE